MPREGRLDYSSPFRSNSLTTPRIGPFDRLRTGFTRHL